MHARLATSLLALAAVAAPAAALAAASAPAAGPVIVISTKNLGKVLATPGKLGLYTWDTERKAKGRILCTGACAAKWPPIVLAANARVPMHVAGVMGTFGTRKRPDGRTQLTYDHLAVYTFQGDTPGVVLCDGVDGWRAVRVH